MTSEYVLERTVLIRATQETVFRYFTDSTRFAAWWGKGSQIDSRPGGAVKIVYPGGVVASGEVIEIAAPERVVFTYGYEDPSKPIRPGASRVTITLARADGDAGTLVRLVHDRLPDEATRDMHVPGWRFQLALFANVAANEQHAALVERIDGWFAAWNGASLPSVTQDVSLRDAYACVTGREELGAHIAAARVHMPLTLVRTGEPRHCQGAALCDWAASSGDGTVRARGTNLFEFAADGRIHAVTGFWAAP
jgi:uncharacterized protein YndB with AHSA1/START domain